jgi:hypothetical protein
MTSRKFYGSQYVLLVCALDDDARLSLRSWVPIKNPSRAFVYGIAGEDQASFKFSSQSLNRVSAEILFVGYAKAPTASGEPECSHGSERVSDEIASRVPTHLC